MRRLCLFAYALWAAAASSAALCEALRSTGAARVLRQAAVLQAPNPAFASEAQRAWSVSLPSIWPRSPATSRSDSSGSLHSYGKLERQAEYVQHGFAVEDLRYRPVDLLSKLRELLRWRSRVGDNISSSFAQEFESLIVEGIVVLHRMSNKLPMGSRALEALRCLYFEKAAYTRLVRDHRPTIGGVAYTSDTSDTSETLRLLDCVEEYFEKQVRGLELLSLAAASERGENLDRRNLPSHLWSDHRRLFSPIGRQRRLLQKYKRAMRLRMKGKGMDWHAIAALNAEIKGSTISFPQTMRSFPPSK